jgi:hypothetical protein
MSPSIKFSFIPNVGLNGEIKYDKNKHRYGTVVNKFVRVFSHDFEAAATGFKSFYFVFRCVRKVAKSDC